MAKPVSMKDVTQAVADTQQVLNLGLRQPLNEPPEVRALLFSMVLREFLDNEYARDIPVGWVPGRNGTVT